MRALLVSVVLFVVLTFTGSAFAAGEIALYEAGAHQPGPAGIAAGPDGNLWFTDAGVNGAAGIGSITTGGVATEHKLAGQLPRSGITAGPDKALWFTEPAVSTGIGRLTTTGQEERFEVKKGEPWQIAESRSADGKPDGNLWFTIHGTEHKIGYINDSTKTVTEVGLEVAGQPEDIVGGPEGDLWVTVPASHKIVRVNPSEPKEQHAFEIEGGLEPSRISATFTPPNGELWFTVKNAAEVGRLVPNKQETPTLKMFSVLVGKGAGSSTNDIAVGPEGDLWFTYNKLAEIGRLAPESFTEGKLLEGRFSAWPIPSVSKTKPEEEDYANASTEEREQLEQRASEEHAKHEEYGAGAITAGADGNMWFTLPAPGTTRGRIGRPESRLTRAVTMATPADGPSLGTAPDGTWMWMSCFLKKSGSMS